MTKETNEGATPTANTAASTAIHRAAHSTARGEQGADRRATSQLPQHTARQASQAQAEHTQQPRDAPATGHPRLSARGQVHRHRRQHASPSYGRAGYDLRTQRRYPQPCHSRHQSDKNNSPTNLRISQVCYTFVLSK